MVQPRGGGQLARAAQQGGRQAQGRAGRGDRRGGRRGSRSPGRPVLAVHRPGRCRVPRAGTGSRSASRTACASRSGRDVTESFARRSRRGRARRSLSARCGARRRRHGRGVPRDPPRDGPQGRGQAAQAAPDERRRRAPAVRARGARDAQGRLAARGQGPRLRRHAARATTTWCSSTSTGAPCSASSRSTGRSRRRASSTSRGRRCTRSAPPTARPRPPRRQARQPAADAGRRRSRLHEGARLRRREADGGRARARSSRARADAGGHGVRHAGVHVAGAGVRPRARRAQRSVLARRDDVRDADRLRAVRGQEPRSSG